jgi:septation ring formation regulator EzrA
MTRLAPVLLVLLAFAAVSCDGDDAPSQEEFAQQANEICREAKQSLKSVGEGAEGPEDIIEAIDEVIEESRNTVDELADLERPDGEAGETAERFVDATRREIENEGIPALEELRGAVEAEDRGAIQETARRLRRIDTSASNKAARELGANACAEGGRGG